MADIDDLLDDEMDDAGPAGAETRSIRDIREAEKRARDALRKQNKELEELRSFKAEAEQRSREVAVAEVFKEIGLKPKHAKFYQGEDVSAEAVKAWAIAEELLDAASEEEPEEAPAPPETGFTPTVIAGATVGTRVYDAEEFEKLARMDPKKAAEIYKAGRVRKDEPWTVGKPMSFDHGALD